MVKNCSARNPDAELAYGFLRAKISPNSLGRGRFYGGIFVKVIILILFLVALIAFPASAQETKNEAGFLLGSEQIPGSTTTAGAPLSVGAGGLFV